MMYKIVRVLIYNIDWERITISIVNELQHRLVIDFGCIKKAPKTKPVAFTCNRLRIYYPLICCYISFFSYAYTMRAATKARIA